jgi:capsular polysaccharide transport system permease protein
MMSSLSAFRGYLRILAALLRREEESRRQAPRESIVSLLEPIILVATLSLLFYFLNRRQTSPLGGSPILYYATGFFPLYLFIYISRRMGGAIDAPTRRFPIEQRLDHIIVHIVLRIIDYAVVGIVGFGFLYFFFTPDARPHDIVDVFLASVAIVCLGFGWGLLTIVVIRKQPLLNFVFPMISRSLILFSGVFFLPDFLPPDTRYVLSFNPMLHAIALFKEGFYPQYQPIVLDKVYLAGCAIFALCLGFVVERLTRRSEGQRIRRRKKRK